MKQLLVSIKFLSDEEGGRPEPVQFKNTYYSYMPHFRVIGETEYLGVRFLGTIHKTIIPEKIYEEIVQLIYYPDLTYEKLVEGAKFEILEGPRIVGIGFVIGEIE